MEALNAILTRRSIRKYTSQDVTNEQVEILLKSAMYAPSAVNKQPWHFIVFRDKFIANKIIEFHPNAWMLKDASVAIVVCYDENLQHDTGFGHIDCSAATQNILLSAHSTGLGAVWIGLYPRQQRIDEVHNLFCLPENIKPFSIVSVGYPAEKKPFPDRYMKERIHYENW